MGIAREAWNERGDIVVGVDGSAESFAALQWALDEAALTGSAVNAVYAWSHSWDAGSRPQSEEDWERARQDITRRLLSWVEEASRGMSFDHDRLKLTSVHASGTSGLLQIGSDARQIVVGRRSLGRVTRWFVGSLSASLAESAKVPVTVVRVAGSEDQHVEDSIARSLAPEVTIHHDADSVTSPQESRPVVVGVDGSETSRHALRFAAREAALHDVPLHVMFCWQLRDLGEVPGYENAVAPLDAGQEYAMSIARRTLDGIDVEPDVDVHVNAFHIAAAKGLANASRYASHLVVGSRGLSGLDAHFLGSVSRQILNFAECTVTVVH
ncbi:universal stress protein [Bifidobacterium leontopitheci]|nr:universal stress protein [Bifidobacterium leontopitheci]